ncbi:FAD-dependent oxidoreductase [Isoptericola halotolerans]|uniref:FAD-dependent oxidoreductase n=1 Tax=Isoptericola halotolerans TaxID=300560 RepID=UPI00388EAE86
METKTQHPVVVIGAGPVGLAAAAHLLERGLEPLVLEAGDGPGAAVADWGHVRLFSPWRYCVDAAARRLLEADSTWREPDLDTLPTGAELVRDYLTPLAATPALRDRIRYGTRVTAVARDGADRTRSLGRERRPWLVRTESDGGTRDLRAAAVLDASGTYGRPNPLGASGLPAIGEPEAAAFLAGPLPDVLGRDRDRFAGRRVLVVGMGHSAANTLLALTHLADEEPGTEVVWAIRGGSPRRLFGGGTDDELPARGLLGTRLREAVDAGRLELWTRVGIEHLEATDGRLRVSGTGRAPGERAEGPFDAVVDVVSAATGFRPDLDMLREVRLDLDDVVEAPARLAPLIDPNLHSCGTVSPHGESVLSHPDEGFYLVGMKSYGRAPTFLLATGYEQVRSVAAALAGDRAAADAVELELPETGVCSTDVADDGETAGACCGGSAEPQLVSLGVGAPAGAPAVGFATGVLHGRSGDD